ncbi:uncharacterized protein LOC133130690 [Conger conger]|uniref:uncharacterized protein LOC133130690 n=1 Tax=Conger conger TaxID=82655 RepID=UPI002A5A97F5|nr:uncharacterized protein LOC133130690 [Conger conger]
MRTTVILLYTCWIAGLHISFTQSKKLNCIVGERVHFQTAVKNDGHMYKNGSKIGKVIESKFHIINERYSDRLQWDKSTGLFSLSGLKMEDSGAYKVENNDGPQTVDIYQLTVYNPVPRPQVSSRSRVKPSCSVLCSVENGRELTLSWHREGQILSYTSSPNLSTPLSLPLEIEENSAPYSCVAENPARKEIVLVKPAMVTVPMMQCCM